MAPTPDILRRKALYAAASVVMAFGLGCGDKDDDADSAGDSGANTDVGDDGTGGDGAGTGGDDGAGTGGDGAGTGGDDGAGTGGDDGAGTGGDGAGTGGDDGAGTGGDDGAGTGGDTAPDCTQASDMATCCEELAEWCNETHGADTDAAVECIYGPDFDGSTGCIPWGPPVPPSMS